MFITVVAMIVFGGIIAVNFVVWSIIDEYVVKYMMIIISLLHLKTYLYTSLSDPGIALPTPTNDHTFTSLTQ